MSLTDAATKQSARTLADAGALADTLLQRAAARVFADGLAVLDNLGPRALGRTLADALALVENFIPKLLAVLGRFPHLFAAQVWARFFPATVLLRSWSANETMIYADPKDPESIEDYLLDWTAAAQGDPITASNWEVPNSDLTIVAMNNTPTTATARISGGVAGQQYTVKNVVTCLSGQVRAQALLLPVNV